MSFFYIIIGVSIIIPIIIIISNIIAFQGYHENGELDDDIAEMLVSSFDCNCQKNTSEDIISKQSKSDLGQDDEIIRLRRRFRSRS
jgi:hypothetical protein